MLSKISAIALLSLTENYSVEAKRNILEKIGSHTLHPKVQGANQAYCDGKGAAAVKRLRTSPPDVDLIKKGSTVFDDTDFKGNAALY